MSLWDVTSPGRLPSSDRPETWPSSRPGGEGMKQEALKVAWTSHTQPLESPSMAESFLGVEATGWRNRNDWEVPAKVPASLVCLLSFTISSLFSLSIPSNTFSLPACSLCQHPSFRGNSKSPWVGDNTFYCGFQWSGGGGGLACGRPEGFWVTGGTLTPKAGKGPRTPSPCKHPVRYPVR